ncbi:MAG TPA: metal ABC transporter substrate-binding protein [Rhodospirillales bacterium]|nr:metal ABC transporter substrate-binding protein [Rhodospirillales bacterium]
MTPSALLLPRALLLRAVLLVAAVAGMATGWAGTLLADPPVKAVASFSILADMVGEVGGERVKLTTLVGPDGDGHVYQPTPADAKAVATATIVFVNGLGFEGWMDRLVESANFTGPLVVASKGVEPLAVGGGASGEGADAHAGHGHGEIDPHAWQSLENGKKYVRAIADALSEVDPAGAGVYRANADRYLADIEMLEQEVRASIAALPEGRRSIVTSHDAFGYFARAYGLRVLSPEGVSTESEASAGDVAALITQIRKEAIPAVFMENITDPRLLEQIRRETGAVMGGTLYSDALSEADGPAPTYLRMFRHNVQTLTQALSS